MRKRLQIAAVLILLLLTPTLAQQTVTSPKQQFGSNVGDDYFLVNYSQMIAYWKKLDAESERLRLVDIGRTSEGRTMTMAVITSPANQRNLDRYQDISRRLARSEGITEQQARALAGEGKAVVWIDGGLHANETLGAQQLVETVYQLVSNNDPETVRVLNDVIVLATIANPDGMEMVSNWYMRQSDPAQRSLGGLPTLYQKYAGHDDNRDFYMSALSETRAINGVLYRDWIPQIVYDHHQAGPEGTVMFSPPFRDPFNFNFDPLVVTMLDEVAGAMHSRFAAEDKPGVVSRSASNYSTWWNGGMRTSPYFHNMIGLLTESIGNPTPMQIPFVIGKQLPTGDSPMPIAPQTWHFRQSIEYSLTANRAVIDYASRNKDRLLLNIYKMGRNSIDRGNRDTWTVTPREVAEVQAVPQGNRNLQMLRKPENRDPRGYIIPSEQPDFLTATKFVNALIWNGVKVDRASAAFRVGGKSYPAGSFIVKTAQSFRPHVLDMFEPQDHPDDIPYPGASPTPPYDSAGWTLAYQMGVRFDRVLDAFDGPFGAVSGVVTPNAGTITQVDRPAGYVFTHEANDAFIAVNRLLSSGEAVYWLRPNGTNYVRAGNGTLAKLQQLSREVGLSFTAVASAPEKNALQLKPVRIALWDRAGGSSPSGWTRYVLEQFEFPYTVIYGEKLDAGNLAESFDVLILVDDASFATGAARAGGLTTATTVPQVKKFMEAGGTVLAIGGSTTLASYAGVPVGDAVAGLARTRFYVPGSVVQARVDRENPIAFGMGERADFFFDHSPSFELDDAAKKAGVRSVAWFDNDKPLRSGWALGQAFLKDTVAVVEAPVGKGKLVLYGPEILFRAQPHGTFKLLFNGIFAGHAQPVELR